MAKIGQPPRQPAIGLPAGPQAGQGQGMPQLTPIQSPPVPRGANIASGTSISGGGGGAGAAFARAGREKTRQKERGEDIERADQKERRVAESRVAEVRYTKNWEALRDAKRAERESRFAVAQASSTTFNQLADTGRATKTDLDNHIKAMQGLFEPIRYGDVIDDRYLNDMSAIYGDLGTGGEAGAYSNVEMTPERAAAVRRVQSPEFLSRSVSDDIGLASFAAVLATRMKVGADKADRKRLGGAVLATLDRVKSKIVERTLKFQEPLFRSVGYSGPIGNEFYANPGSAISNDEGWHSLDTLIAAGIEDRKAMKVGPPNSLLYYWERMNPAGSPIDKVVRDILDGGGDVRATVTDAPPWALREASGSQMIRDDGGGIIGEPVQVQNPLHTIDPSLVQPYSMQMVKAAEFLNRRAQDIEDPRQKAEVRIFAQAMNEIGGMLMQNHAGVSYVPNGKRLVDAMDAASAQLWDASPEALDETRGIVGEGIDFITEEFDPLLIPEIMAMDTGVRDVNLAFPDGGIYRTRIESAVPETMWERYVKPSVGAGGTAAFDRAAGLPEAPEVVDTSAFEEMMRSSADLPD